MADKYDCITFHTPACDDHVDRIINVHGHEGLDDICPICRIAELEAALEDNLHEALYQKQVKELQTRIAELEAAILDFFVHDKRETRTALRDLVGGFDGVDQYKAALKGDD